MATWNALFGAAAPWETRSITTATANAAHDVKGILDCRWHATKKVQRRCNHTSRPAD